MLVSAVRKAVSSKSSGFPKACRATMHFERSVPFRVAHFVDEIHGALNRCGSLDRLMCVPNIDQVWGGFHGSHADFHRN